jgi:hypothetical protein
MKILARASLLALAAALGACAQQAGPPVSDPKAQSMAEASGTIVVEDQAVRGGVIRIKEVKISENGFVVIHETTADGKPVAPDSIGHAFVHRGENGNVAVRLSKPVKRGATLIAMLHRDTGQQGVYTFAPGNTAEDQPLMVKGAAVVVPFKIK